MRCPPPHERGALRRPAENSTPPGCPPPPEGIRQGRGESAGKRARILTPSWARGWAIFLLGLTGLVTGSSVTAWGASALPPYPAWREACRKLPLNRDLGDRMPGKDLLPLRSFAEFEAALGPCLDLYRTGSLATASAWVGGMPGKGTFFNLETGYFQHPNTPFEPFAQRELVPPGTRVFFHGDLHGDIHSLLAYLDLLNQEGHLDGFRVVRPEVRLVFLGDYTDRGKYGVEVFYTLLRLKLANPEQVLLVRGNHEDLLLVSRYGFLAEATAKFGRDLDARRVVRFYDFLPAVLYLGTGTNLVQCNHGGMEPGFTPGTLLGAPGTARYQLLGRLEQRKLLTAEAPWLATQPAATRRLLDTGLADFEPKSPTTPTVLGFLWNDFTVFAGEPQFAVDPGRAFVYGDELTRRILDRGSLPTARIRALFRGHQHSGELNPLMRRLVASQGIHRHWQTNDDPRLKDAPVARLRERLESVPDRAIPDGSVWTFNVSPDSVYGAGCDFGFDTAGDVVTAEAWAGWRLRVRNVLVVPGR